MWHAWCMPHILYLHTAHMFTYIRTWIYVYIYRCIYMYAAHTHTPTHPHLLRTIFANSDVECILRAKTLQLHLTGMGRWNDPRNIEKVSSPCPVLEEISWQIATTVQRNRKNRNQLFDMPVLGLAGCHCSEKCRYVDKRPHRYHRQQMSVFVSAGLISAPDTPCWKTK